MRPLPPEVNPARWHTTEAPGDWRKDGACHNRPELTDTFFPEDDEFATIREAKEVCEGCPVRDQCFEYAMSTNQMFGIWGGRSEEERRKLRKSWVRARRLSI